MASPLGRTAEAAIGAIACAYSIASRCCMLGILQLNLFLLLLLQITENRCQCNHKRLLKTRSRRLLQSLALPAPRQLPLGVAPSPILVQ